jgi:hypothetical protein
VPACLVIKTYAEMYAPDTYASIRLVMLNTHAFLRRTLLVSQECTAGLKFN